MESVSIAVCVDCGMINPPNRPTCLNCKSWSLDVHSIKSTKTKEYRRN